VVVGLVDGGGLWWVAVVVLFIWMVPAQLAVGVARGWPEGGFLLEIQIERRNKLKQNNWYLH
jgi:hypothetical protein